MTYIRLFVLTCILVLLASCKKEEGPGGTASVKGVLYNIIYNKDCNVFQNQVASVEEDVYIIFGDNSFYGETVETSANGSFEFEYLRPGDYTIFFYSEDTSSENRGNKVPIYHEVTLSAKKTTNLDTLYRFELLDFDDGTSSITGKIYVRNYSKEFVSLIDVTPAQQEDVFLIYNNHTYNDSRERTLYDGTFTFPNLLIGHYTIYVFSDNPSGSSERLTEIRDVDIKSKNQTIDLGTIYINHED